MTLAELCISLPSELWLLSVFTGAAVTGIRKEQKEEVEEEKEAVEWSVWMNLQNIPS